MNKTGVKASKEDYDRLIALAQRGWLPGDMVIVTSVDEGIQKDKATIDAQLACHRLALSYGLPEIQGYYGINKDGEFVTV